MKRGPVAEKKKASAVRDYLNGNSLEKVAKKHGVWASTVRKWVMSCGHRCRPHGMASKGVNWDSVPLGTVPDKEIAERIGCSVQAVHKQRAARGIRARRRYTDKEKALVIAAYERGLTRAAAGAVVGVTASTVSAWMKDAGVVARKIAHRFHLGITAQQLKALDKWRGDRSRQQAMRDLIDALKDKETMP